MAGAVRTVPSEREVIHLNFKKENNVQKERYVKIKKSDGKWYIAHFKDLKKGDFFEIYEPDGMKVRATDVSYFIADEDAGGYDGGVLGIRCTPIMKENEQGESIMPDVEYEEDPALNKAIWTDAMRYMMALQGSFLTECGDEKINHCSLSIGLMLWSIRLTRSAGRVRKEEFIAQCSNIWDAGLSTVSDEEIHTIVLSTDLEKEKPNGPSK